MGKSGRRLIGLRCRCGGGSHRGCALLLVLARFGGGGSLGGGTLALLALGGDLRGLGGFLLLALGLVFLATVDTSLAGRQRVDLERALQLVRGVLVDRAGGSLHLHAELLEPVDDVLAREPEIPGELKDPNASHPSPLRPHLWPPRPV
jgi:hypothetical protein